MLLDIAQALSFFLSIFSLYPVILNAFFIPGSTWEDRLILALARVGLAGCVCFFSGILFARPWRPGHSSDELLATLPVQLYLWTLAGVAVLFALAWYMDLYVVPMIWKNLPG